MNQTSSIEEQDPPKQEHHQDESLDVFLKKLEQITSIEEKVQACVTYMKHALSQSGSPNFKGFWEIRKQCLPLFKDLPVGQNRSQLWDEFIELTREGRRLKNLLDEETAFAVEQIEIAVKALEDEVQAYHEQPEEILLKSTDVEFPKEIKTLETRWESFKQLQRNLNLLNTYASRINGLRKELIKTDMRIRQKNKFFERLSALGDQVFPQRKDMIKEVSDGFVEDITRFVDENFSDRNFNYEHIRKSVFFYREEIKNLQSLAKILTLNTHAFTLTRELLSSSWDKLKGMEKELKKEVTQQKQKSSENSGQVRAKIEEVRLVIKEEKASNDEIFKQLDEISRWMRDVELVHSDVKSLKDELKQVRSLVEEKKEQADQQRRQKEAEAEQKRQKVVEEFKIRLASLKENIAELDENKLCECKKELATLPITKGERQLIERSLKAIRDQLAEKKEQTLLELSDDAKAALSNLNEILEQRKQRRSEIKSQIEEYRKIIGGSGLDFERAIEYNELMGTEKERLEKVDEGIREIELKMKELKKKN